MLAVENPKDAPRADASACVPRTAASEELPLELRRRLPDRDPEALGAFFDVWFDRVWGYVRRLVGEEHLAEDLTQEIFLHIHRALPTYDPERDLRPWVFTIATNKVRDYWRSRRHKESLRELPIDEEAGETLSSSRARPPHERLERQELAAQVAAAIERLPESMRTTLVLRYFEGLSFEAIGRIVDRNEAAVRKRYSRALEELRRVLGPILGL